MTASSTINVLESLEKLYRDSRITKQAHDIANERKKTIRYVLGITAMVLSVFVATGLVELVASDKSTAIIIKLLTFFSAIFAGALTFLNYEKEAKTHSSAVGVYANICRSAEFLIAKARDNLITPEKTTREIDALMQQYFKANLNYENCIPTNKDFHKARLNIEAKDEANATRMSFRLFLVVEKGQCSRKNCREKRQQLNNNSCRFVRDH